jgi:hypothetical protein
LLLLEGVSCTFLGTIFWLKKTKYIVVDCWVKFEVLFLACSISVKERNYSVDSNSIIFWRSHRELGARFEGTLWKAIFGANRTRIPGRTDPRLEFFWWDSSFFCGLPGLRVFYEKNQNFINSGLFWVVFLRFNNPRLFTTIQDHQNRTYSLKFAGQQCPTVFTQRLSKVRIFIGLGLSGVALIQAGGWVPWESPVLVLFCKALDWYLFWPYRWRQLTANCWQDSVPVTAFCGL